MPERSPAARLDQAITALLAGAPPAADTPLAALVYVAAGLRDLPRPDFKARLKADLERKASMATPAVTPLREGFHSLTPYLIVEGAAKTIETFKPSMLIEVHPVQLETVFKSSGQAVFDKLQSWGYRTFAKMPAWQECKAPVPWRKPWKDYACLHADRHRDQIAKLLST